jgi:signal transduction histidine kinase
MRNGVPLFLDQLVERLREATTTSDVIEASAARHGGEMLAMGFSVSQVVRGYGDVCQAITQLADELDAPISVEEFQTFNRCLDDAIAQSVTEYERLRDKSVACEGTERMGALAHEMGNRVTAALVAFNILKSGAVGMHGSTGAVLGRSLCALRSLINNALADVRLGSGLGRTERIVVSHLMSEVETEAAMSAEVRGADLVVSSVPEDVAVQGDRQILAAALANILQNAFKFSHASPRVSLRAIATAEEVRFEVEDECGGLPPGRVDELFQPFEQRGANRSGLGLGLSSSRKGVEAMGGTIGVRDLPGRGCVFSVVLPRLPTDVSHAN